MFAHPPLRLARSRSSEWLPRHGDRRGDRLLRPDRTRRRQRPGLHAHARPPRRRRLGAQRRQDVDHQRHAGRGRRSCGRSTDDGIRGFVVPTTRPASPRTRSTASSRCARRSPPNWSLDDVRLPADADAARGARPKGPLSCLERGPLRHRLGRGRRGARLLRRSTAVLAGARPSSTSRWPASSSPSASSPTWSLGGQQRELVAARLGPAQGRGHDRAAQISYGKLHNVRSALEVARSARGLLGAAGITLDHTVMRHMVNLETVSTYEGTEEMHALSIGQAVTGIPAFR